MDNARVGVWFLALCVEIYKNAKGLSGKDAFNLLARSGAAGFVVDCADALHTTGELYIIDCIDEYMALRGETVPASKVT